MDANHEEHDPEVDTPDVNLLTKVGSHIPMVAEALRIEAAVDVTAIPAEGFAIEHASMGEEHDVTCEGSEKMLNYELGQVLRAKGGGWRSFRTPSRARAVAKWEQRSAVFHASGKKASESSLSYVCD